MEKQAAELLAVIGNDRITDDVKIDLLSKLRSRVKHHALPEVAVDVVFQVIRAALDNPPLQDSGFSILSNCSKRMVLQDQHELLAFECDMTMSNILESFGSESVRIQQRATQTLVDLWGALLLQGDSASKIEGAVQQRAVYGNRTVVLTTLAWLQRMQQEYPTHFEPQHHFLSLMITFLANPDIEVSSTARFTMPKLFRQGDFATKNQLRRELLSSDISRTMRETVSTECGIRPSSSGSDTSRRSSSIPRSLSRPRSSHQAHSTLSHSHTTSNSGATSSHMSSRPLSTSKSMATLSGSVKKENVQTERLTTQHEPSRKGARTPAPALESADPLPPTVPAATRAELDPSKPINIESNGTFFLSKHLTADYQDITSKLDEQSRLMAPVFEGRETEQNWSLREKCLTIMRKITKGNGPIDFRTAYIAMIRANLDGILRSTSSLRTSMQKNGCYLLQEAVQAVGPGLDPIVEFAMQTLLKLSSDTKSIAAEHANATITVILNHVSYKNSLLQHVNTASTNKNQRPRLFAQGWLNNIMSRHVNHKSTLDHGNGMETIEKTINKGLSDADPTVRETARNTYWTFNSIWPVRAEAILNKLGSSAQKLLLDHPSNPDPSASKSSATTAASSGAARSQSRAGGAAPKPSIREVMAAKRKEKEQSQAQAASHSGSTQSKKPAKPATTSNTSRPAAGSRSATATPTTNRPQSSTSSSMRSTAGRPAAPATKKTVTRPALPVSSGSLSSAPIRPSRAKTPTSNGSTLRAARPAPRPTTAPPPATEEDTPEKPVAIAAPRDPSPRKPVDSPKTVVAETPLAIRSLPQRPASAEPVVYEEPDTADEQSAKPASPDNTARPPLSELNIQADTMPLEDTNDEASAYSKKPANKQQQPQEEISWDASAIIDSGINRITANTLDAHGFRKLNSTISNNLAALNESKLSSLVQGVLARLADTTSPSDDRIVMQQNLLLRILFQGKKDFIMKFTPDVLSNLICATSRYAEQSHVAQTLARSVLDFVRAMDRTALVTLSKLTDLLGRHELSSFGVSSCLAAMDSLITEHAVHLDEDENLLKGILRQALKASSSGEVPVRRHANGVARAACKNMNSPEKFWEIFFSIEHANRTMLLYSLKYDEVARKAPEATN